MSKASDGDTSTIRKALTERTPVMVPLGLIIGSFISIALAAGGWALWMTVSIWQLKVDVAEVKAAITHTTSTTEGMAIK